MTTKLPQNYSLEDIDALVSEAKAARAAEMTVVLRELATLVKHAVSRVVHIGRSHPQAGAWA